MFSHGNHPSDGPSRYRSPGTPQPEIRTGKLPDCERRCEDKNIYPDAHSRCTGRGFWDGRNGQPTGAAFCQGGGGHRVPAPKNSKFGICADGFPPVWSGHSDLSL